MILQKLKYNVKDDLQLAEIYFSLMSTLNGLDFAKREVQLLAFVSTHGISGDRDKEEFVKVFSSSLATVGNIISKLSKPKVGVLIKDGKKVSVHPALQLDFNKSLKLEITLENVKHKQTT